MESSLGKRIAKLRKDKKLSQDNLADMLGVTPQAVSKWENDQTCPDISLLPKLANIFNISIDELLNGEQDNDKKVKIDTHKNIEDMFLKILVLTHDKNKVKLNIPILLIKSAMKLGNGIPKISGNISLDAIDFKEILKLIDNGVVGNLMEIETNEGDIIKIIVE